MKKSYKIAGGLCAATLAVALLSSTALNNEYLSFKKEVKQTTGIGFAGGISQPKTVAVAPKSAEPPPLPVVEPMVAAPQALPVPVAPPSIPAPVLAAPMEKEKKADISSVLSQLKSSDRKAPPPSGAVLGFAGKDSAALGGVAQNRAVMAESMVAPSFAPDVIAQPGYHDEGLDKFKHTQDNPVKLTKEEPVSTFSVDVDTSSYSFMRASLNNNVLPQKDSVRVEEMVNYFPYDYAHPSDKAEPFKASVSVMPSPWNKGTKLVHIGIKGYEMQQAEKPHSNLVFLVDTSGSMNEPNKLPLLKNSLKLLLDSLQPDDSVAIVTYAGSAGTALEPTLVKDKAKILASIESFNSGGSTAGAEGIRQAYELAKRNFDKKGVNRVILATDGDFNVGITDQNELKSFIERERDSGVFLSVLGFGQGNYNDAMMQTLAQNGNGNAAYIDNLNEARKVLVDEASSTLFTIAKDVKLQVEWNPAKVAEYRLIGYETRMLKREDFNNDKVDAGDIGAGHTVTAIYEITPTDSDAKLVDELRYGKDKPAETKEAKSGEYGFLKIRYKLPKETVSKLITTPIDGKVEVSSIDKVSTEARFATSVAAFGQLLRGEGMTKEFSYDDVIGLAQSAKGEDKFGYRAEFINLVRLAKSAAGLKPLENGQRPPVVEPQPYPVPMMAR